MSADYHLATFLDVEISKDQGWQETGLLDTKVHFKQENCLTLVHGHSAHQPHVFQGIVTSQFIRYARICSRLEYFHKAANKLCNALVHRGYSLKRLLIPLKYEVSEQIFTTKPSAGQCT